ncbi:MAG: penicillin acylase family protein [Phenylobacterium sp.]|nr:penicillin acylase family protein [Phenylobacterium sp.]
MRGWLLALAIILSPVAAWADELAAWKAQAARTSIVRDEWGIPHVRGKTDADAVFAAIYAQAEDDFHRIEMNYLTALGRVAEAEGASALWQDLRMRLFIDPEDLKARYAGSPQALRVLMDAWADGLNYYLATHPQTRPRVLTRFEPWMALSFTEGSIGGDIERISLAELEAFYGGTRTARAEPFVFQDPPGSNGIALAPKLTRDGHALLLINPHTSFFFRSELQMSSDEGLNAYGAATWGQFFIYQGFNSHAGWMHTSSGVDVVDEFAETIVRTPGALMYRYGREARPVTVTPITLAYRTEDGGLGRRTFTTYRTHHGPIVRSEGERWIATALMFRPVEALQQSFGRTKARALDQFLSVAALKANSSNATLYADRDGRTAYLHPQFIPRRDDRFDYTRPVDGADPATDWQGLHELAETPHVIDARAGWTYNANDWPYAAAGEDSPRREAFPRYMDTAGPTPRGEHAVRVLKGRSGFTPESLRAAAYDPDLPAFDKLIPRLSAAYAAADPTVRARLAEPVGSLAAWDRRWGLESVETSLAVFWAEALFAKAQPIARAESRKPFDVMVETSTDGDYLAALEEAVARLTADFGRWRTPWGEINRLQRLTGEIQQAFRDDAPSVGVPFTAGTWGSLASFAARRYPGTRRYYGTSGNSFVAVVEFGPKVKAMAVSSGGQSGDPASPHFNDQAELYAAGQMRPVRFHPEDLAGLRSYRPGER